MKILAVDDEESMRYLLLRFLTRAGHEVRVAVDGNDALRLIHDMPPDLLITDLNMPGMGGLELIHLTMASHQSLPIIVLSGDDQMIKTLQSDPALISVKIASKPFDGTSLLGLIRDLSPPI